MNLRKIENKCEMFGGNSRQARDILEDKTNMRKKNCGKFKKAIGIEIFEKYEENLRQL